MAIWQYGSVVFASMLIMCGSLAAQDTTYQVVELRPQAGVSGKLVGDIELGEVLAGTDVSVKFKVKNSSDQVVEFSSVSPSCKCTDVRLPSSKVGPGQILDQVADVRVKIPDVRGNNVTIAGVQINTSTGVEAAILRIKANIRRALFVPIQISTFTLDSADDFETTLSLDVDPKWSPSQIQIRSETPSVEIEIQRAVTGEWPCTLLLKGRRDKLLEAQVLAVEISLPSESIRDVIRFQFYDGLLFRTIPAIPIVKSGKVNFILFRKAGVDASKLHVRDSRGSQVKASFKQRTKSLVDVTAEVLDGTSEYVLLLDNDEFTFTVVKETDDE